MALKRLRLPGANFQISKGGSTKVAARAKRGDVKGKRSGRKGKARVEANLPEKSISSLSALGPEFTWKKLSSLPQARDDKPIPSTPRTHRTKKNLKNPAIQNFQFTTWPVTEKAFKTNPVLSRLYRTYDEMKMMGSADDVFKYAEPQMEEESLVYDKLPSIVQRIEIKNKLQMSLAPKRGGFIWPGNEPLKFKFTQLSQQLETLQKWFKKDSLSSGKISGKNRF